MVPRRPRRREAVNATAGQAWQYLQRDLVVQTPIIY